MKSPVRMQSDRAFAIETHLYSKTAAFGKSYISVIYRAITGMSASAVFGT